MKSLTESILNTSGVGLSAIKKELNQRFVDSLRIYNSDLKQYYERHFIDIHGNIIEPYYNYNLRLFDKDEMYFKENIDLYDNVFSIHVNNFYDFIKKCDEYNLKLHINTLELYDKNVFKKAFDTCINEALNVFQFENIAIYCDSFKDINNTEVQNLSKLTHKLTTNKTCILNMGYNAGGMYYNSPLIQNLETLLNINVPNVIISFASFEKGSRYFEVALDTFYDVILKLKNVKFKSLTIRENGIFKSCEYDITDFDKKQSDLINMFHEKNPNCKLQFEYVK